MANKLTLGFIMGLLAFSAQAEIIVQEDFEGQGQGCGPNGGWYEVYQMTFDGSNPHGGSCSASKHYQSDEDVGILRHNGGGNSKILHGVYWVYYSTSGNWPRHQKMNRFYQISTGGSRYIGVGHPYQNGSTIQSYTSQQPESPLSCAYDWSGTWSNKTGSWHKVEFYAEIRPGGSGGTCNGANDIFRVWIDDQIHLDRSDWQIDNGNASSTWKGFWIFGNSSAEQGQCDGAAGCKTIYMDDVCIATTAGECGGLAAQGVSTDGPQGNDSPVPSPTDLQRTDTTDFSEN